MNSGPLNIASLQFKNGNFSLFYYPYSLLPTLYSLLPTPYSLLPIKIS
ncbi:hypothetical protein [Moorena producens]